MKQQDMCNFFAYTRQICTLKYISLFFCIFKFWTMTMMCKRMLWSFCYLVLVRFLVLSLLCKYRWSPRSHPIQKLINKIKINERDCLDISKQIEKKNTDHERNERKREGLRWTLSTKITWCELNVQLDCNSIF